MMSFIYTKGSILDFHLPRPQQEGTRHNSQRFHRIMKDGLRFGCVILGRSLLGTNASGCEGWVDGFMERVRRLVHGMDEGRVRRYITSSQLTN